MPSSLPQRRNPKPTGADGTDRLALIRARFEILRRDAEIDCLRRRLAALEPPGGRLDEVGARRLRATLSHLEEECAFFEQLAENGAPTVQERERARTIAHRPWRDARGAARELLSDEELGTLG